MHLMEICIQRLMATKWAATFNTKSCAFCTCNIFVPIPVVARSKLWVCGRSLAGIMGSNPARGRGCLSLVSVVCCQVEISASG
jgi:hypothetical protein